jgi:hypothetical protein
MRYAIALPNGGSVATHGSWRRLAPRLVRAPGARWDGACLYKRTDDGSWQDVTPAVPRGVV